MKRLLKWTAALGALAVGGTLMVRGIQIGRAKVKNALAEAEEVADQTRAALEHTEAALHTARNAI
jgi:enamine deaminase RidA (YjgF/YER057c/UK114 family)